MKDQIIEDFKLKLIGNYSNMNQAYSNPAYWAYINIKFEEISENVIHSKSWYDMHTEDSPYKNSILKLSTMNDCVIMSTSIDNDNIKFADIIFEYKDNFWVGENLKCIIPNKNFYISTSMKFDGINYYSRDAGYNLDTDKKIWGKSPEEGMFHFIKRDS